MKKYSKMIMFLQYLKKNNVNAAFSCFIMNYMLVSNFS